MQFFLLQLYSNSGNYDYKGVRRWTTKKKLGVKALANMEDKRARKYTIQVKTNYQNYFSSNKVLQDAQKNGVPIKRFMVRICFSKTELTYHETKYQFVREVLEKEEYLNANILGRFYKIK